LAVPHVTMEALEAGFDAIGQSPKDRGVLDLIARRPRVDAREILEQGGSRSGEGACRRLLERSPQRTDVRPFTASRHAAQRDELARDRAGRAGQEPLAGDQLFVDLDLSATNIPPETRLALGEAMIEVTAQPHTGCHKFVARFGVDAMKFVNPPLGMRLQLRGINAQVVQPGRIRVGDLVSKLR